MKYTVRDSAWCRLERDNWVGYCRGADLRRSVVCRNGSRRKPLFEKCQKNFQTVLAFFCTDGGALYFSTILPIRLLEKTCDFFHVFVALHVPICYNLDNAMYDYM